MGQPEQLEQGPEHKAPALTLIWQNSMHEYYDAMTLHSLKGRVPKTSTGIYCNGFAFNLSSSTACLRLVALRASVSICHV